MFVYTYYNLIVSRVVCIDLKCLTGRVISVFFFFLSCSYYRVLTFNGVVPSDVNISQQEYCIDMFLLLLCDSDAFSYLFNGYANIYI